MQIEEIDKILAEVKHHDRLQVKIAENKLGLVYIGNFVRNNTIYMYMTNDSGTLLSIPKYLIDSITIIK